MYQSIREWYEQLTGFSGERLTPEWHVKRCKELLKCTKHTVSRKKILRELSWWEKQLLHDKYN